MITHSRSKYQQTKYIQIKYPNTAMFSQFVYNMQGQVELRGYLFWERCNPYKLEIKGIFMTMLIYKAYIAKYFKKYKYKYLCTISVWLVIADYKV